MQHRCGVAKGKQRSRPENEAAVNRRCGYEGKAMVMQRSGDTDEAEGMQ